MRIPSIKILVFTLLLIFYGSFLVHKITLPIADDLARQIKIGETVVKGNFDILYTNVYSYAEPEQVFFNHHWFSGVIFYFLHRAIGWNGLVIFKVVIFLSAFTLLFLTSLKKANFWLVALFSLPVLIMLRERTGLRPEVFSYLFIAVYLYLLIDVEEHPERKRIFWLIPLQLLWVNMHIFFSVGIMMVAGFLAEKAFHRHAEHKNLVRDPFIKKLCVLLLLVAAVSFINPRGAEGVFYHYPGNFPIRISENYSIPLFLQENLVWTDVSVVVFLLMIPILAVSFFFGFRRKQKPIFYFLAGTATAVLSISIIRGLAMFGMMFLPVVSANFDEHVIRARDWLMRETPRMSKAMGNVFVVCLIAVVVYLIVPGWAALYKERGIGLAARSEDSAKFFKEHGLKGPIFNDADIGSYLIYYFYPQEKVFTDNRFADAYSAPFFEEYMAAVADDGAWGTLLKKYNFNVIFLYQYDAAPHTRDFLWRRIHDPAWSLVYVDPYVAIAVRNTPENQGVIQKFQITKENVGERLKYLTESPKFDDQVAAADLFNLIDREDLGRDTFLGVVTTWPHAGKIWMILGQWELENSEPSSPVLAMMFLERALNEGWTTAETYGLLGAAYARMNKPQKAIEVLRESLQRDPERDDTKKLLYRLEKFKIQ